MVVPNTDYITSSGGKFTSPTSIVFNEQPDDYCELSKQVVISPLVQQLGTIAINGQKGGELLQGQVTCDIAGLTDASFLTGAQCTPQGRMLASFRIFQLSDEQRLLQLNTALVPKLIDCLSKYAPFFQVSMDDVSPKYHTFALSGEGSTEVVAELFGQAPNGNAVIQSPDGALAYCVSKDLYQIITSEPLAVSIWQKCLNYAAPAGTDYWTLTNIRAGLGSVTQETSEMFIPQMLNLQAIGAISFKKGCYTGQEIVARTKYRGKLKKRMYRLEITAKKLPAPGTPCLLPEKEQAIGHIVAAAWKNSSSAEVLAVINNDSAQTSNLIIGGHPVQSKYLELPYSLDE